MRIRADLREQGVRPDRGGVGQNERRLEFLRRLPVLFREIKLAPGFISHRRFRVVRAESRRCEQQRREYQNQNFYRLYASHESIT